MQSRNVPTQSQNIFPSSNKRKGHHTLLPSLDNNQHNESIFSVSGQKEDTHSGAKFTLPSSSFEQFPNLNHQSTKNSVT